MDERSAVVKYLDKLSCCTHNFYMMSPKEFVSFLKVIGLYRNWKAVSYHDYRTTLYCVRSFEQHMLSTVNLFATDNKAMHAYVRFISANRRSLYMLLKLRERLLKNGSYNDIIEAYGR